MSGTTVKLVSQSAINAELAAKVFDPRVKNVGNFGAALLAAGKRVNGIA